MVLPATYRQTPLAPAGPLLNADHLIAAGRRLDVPFRLRILDGSGDRNTEMEMGITRILRLLPGKRIVAVAVVDGAEVLVKVYLGKSAARYARRETRGVGLVKRAAVRTPELRWQGRIRDGGGEVLVFEYLTDAVSLYDRWQQAQHEDEKVDVLTRAMVIIARLHNEGVVQNDIHLGNFLLSRGKLFTIDGGGVVRRSGPPLPEGRSLDNLGLFFAQFFHRHDDLVDFVVPAYEAARGMNADRDRVRRIRDRIEHHRARRKRAWLKKALRECTRFVSSSTWRRFIVCERGAFTPAMAELLRDPDAGIDRGRIIKNGNTSTLAVVNVDGRPVVIKRYNLRNIWHRIRRSVRNTRAWTSWTNACRMEFLGIPSVKQVALIENRFGPLRGTSWFITEYIDGEDALTCLSREGKSGGRPEALSRLLHELADCRVSHGDMKATNFMMSDAGPVLIDLDAMREHRTGAGFRRAFRRDKRRFMRNWQDQPELTLCFSGLLEELP